LGSATAAGGGMLSGLGISGGVSSGAGVGAGSGLGAQNNYSSVVLGLASLILEGRPIADDEYQQPQQQQQQVGMVCTGSAGSGAAGGRISPRPSTSRAAINITTNPYGSMGGSENRTGNGSGSAGSPSSSSLTHQRWTQKLCQLRQISPAAQTMSAEPELVSLAINDLNKDHGDYEIVRRVMLNRAGGMGGLVSSSGGGGGGGGGTNNSSAASSPGSNSSDNILHSLQSLATTCLRGGPALAPPPVEPRPLNLAFLWSGSGGSGGRGLGLGLGAAAAASAIAAGSISNTPTTTTATATASSGASSSASRPKHGPHCDQFLRKMGLAKGEMPSEAEEHICDMSYVNMTVSGMFR